MIAEVQLLIVSSRFESKRALLRILDGLPLSVLVAGSVEQAEEALECHDIDVIVCDERVCDGTYHDVLAFTVDRKPKVQFIVTMCGGGYEEYREAMRLGVTEVVRSPLQPGDVELALIHAVRNRSTAAAHAVA